MESSKPSSLKPCPFCDGEAYIDTYGMTRTFGYRVSCRKCPAYVISITRYQAIQTWNTRHELSCEGCARDYDDYCWSCSRHFPDMYEPKVVVKKEPIHFLAGETYVPILSCDGCAFDEPAVHCSWCDDCSRNVRLKDKWIQPQKAVE